LSNPHFRTFTSSEFAFSFSNTLIMTGMPYYLETLLGVSAADYLMLTIGGFIALAFVVRPQIDWRVPKFTSGRWWVNSPPHTHSTAQCGRRLSLPVNPQPRAK
jgi:hypothetical protein